MFKAEIFLYLKKHPLLLIGVIGYQSRTTPNYNSFNFFDINFDYLSYLKICAKYHFNHDAKMRTSSSAINGQPSFRCFVTLAYMYEIRAENIAVVSGTNLIWTFSGFVLINGDRYGAF